MGIKVIININTESIVSEKKTDIHLLEISKRQLYKHSAGNKFWECTCVLTYVFNYI